MLSEWPIDRPRNWVTRVNQPENEAELIALRQCVNRGSPLGATDWVRRAVKRLGLEMTVRSPGRPKRVGAKNGS